MSVVDAVSRDLEGFGPEIAESGLAMAALSLARELDGSNSATSKSMCARALAELLAELRAMAPPKRIEDDVDDLESRRAARRAAARVADAANLPRP